MNSYDRVKAIIEGREVDRPAVSAWKHFHFDDRNVNDSVKAHIAFQEQNDWDFIKIMANGIYMQEQYGASIRWSRDGVEFPTTLIRAAKTPKELKELKVVDVNEGAIHREIEVAKRLVDYYGGKKPVIATAFTPLNYTQELAYFFHNAESFKQFEYDYRQELQEGLKVVTESTQKVIEEFVKAGVDGIFYSTKFATNEQIPEELYEEYVRKSDLEGIAPAIGKTWFNILHVHGDGSLFFDKIKDYPFEAINWQSTRSVSIANAAKLTDKVLVGGVDREWDFKYDNREALYEHLKNRVTTAVEEAKKNRLIITPGCSLPTELPTYRFNVLKEVIVDVFGGEK